MKLIVNEKDGCCESINIEYTPLEALIINEAMRRYVDDEEMRADDRKIMEFMLDVKPIIREIAADAEWVQNIHGKTICSRCGAEKSQWYDEYCSHCGADMRKEQSNADSD